MNRTNVRRPSVQFLSVKRRRARERAALQKVNRAFFRAGAALHIQEAALAFACGQGRVIAIGGRK